jgi:predicted molibdopterin-dependent oxidoreductase YjgC
MGAVPDLFPGGQPFKDNKIRSRLASHWGGKLSPVVGLGFDDMLVACQEGTLQAMWIMGADPASDCRQAGDALGRVPFLLVQDLFMTDTASMAEVVLPAASFAETDGSFTNLTGRLQAIRAAMRPPGEARPDWWIITELARRMVSGKRQRAWEFGSAADVLGEIAKALPGYRGLDTTTMGQEGWQRPVPPAAMRRSLSLVEQSVPKPDADYPLTLVTGRLLYDRGTLLRCSERIQNLVPGAFVMVHPSEAEKMGLTDGDDVSVVSATGRLGLKVRVSDEVVSGVAFAPLNLSEAPLSVLFADGWTLPQVRITK